MTQKFIAGLLPFALGVVIGVLGTFATFSGRIAALEVTTQEHGHQLDDVHSELKNLSNLLLSSLRK